MTFGAGLFAVAICFIATGAMLVLVKGAVAKSPIDYN
jgi:hypothetical protein